MRDGELRVVVVDRDDIIITQPGSDFVAVYFRPRGQSYIVAKATPVGSQDFRTRAWQIAIAKARQLGCIVEGGPRLRAWPLKWNALRQDGVATIRSRIAVRMGE